MEKVIDKLNEAILEFDWLPFEGNPQEEKELNDIYSQLNNCLTRLKKINNKEE